MTDLSKEQWYHGRVSRVDAEKILESHGSVEGSYLVRDSLTMTGEYVLSLCHQVCGGEREGEGGREKGEGEGGRKRGKGGRGRRVEGRRGRGVSMDRGDEKISLVMEVSKGEGSWM